MSKAQRFNAPGPQQPAKNHKARLYNLLTASFMLNGQLGDSNIKLRLPAWAILLVSSIVLVYGFLIVDFHADIIEAAQTDQDNQMLRQELDKLYSGLDSLKIKADTIEARHDSLIIIKNIPTATLKLASINTSSFDTFEYLAKRDLNLATKLAQTNSLLEQLRNRIDASWQTDNDINSYLTLQEQVYDNTPSIYPAFGRISAAYGWRRHPVTGRREFHTGMDIANKRNTPIYATADGVVSFCGRNGNYGKLIKIKHAFGYHTRYGHINKYLVKKGEHVKKGQIIALMGRTGRATGNHVHYEVWRYNKRYNPWRYLNKAPQDIAMDDLRSPVQVSVR